jgi:Domain of unknown function (DUF4281)
MKLCFPLQVLVFATASVDLGHAFTALTAKGSLSPSQVKESVRQGHASSLTARHALLDPMLLSSVTDPSRAATFFPQPFWLFLVLLPNTSVTKKLMGGMEIVTLSCLIHFFIVAASIGEPGATAPLEEFSGVFDPAGNPQAAFLGMMKYPNFVSEEWSHVLSWDLFVGRWIWLDGLRRGIFTSHSVLLCNLIGPPGLLLHWATCLVSGKGMLVDNEAEDL